MLPRVLTVDGAHRLGITDARIRTELRRERWQRLATGVLLTRPDEPTRSDWINAGMALGGSVAVLSGWDAARLRGLGTVSPPDPRVLVLVARGRSRVVGRVQLRPSRRPVRSSQLSALDDDLPSVRVAAPARAVCDTAVLYDRIAPVRSMVASAVQRTLCTPEELAAELRAAQRNGSRLLRLALADVIAGARSVAEAEAVALLRAGGVRGFVVNAPITGSDGRVRYVADLLWPPLRAIVEIDSREFHFSEAGWKQTMARHNALVDLDYVVKHYPPSELRLRKAPWARDVADWLAARALALGVPWP